MFVFIRRVRRALLAEGRLGRYVAYAAGELLLVVAGILIALQIDTWNEQRKDRERELGYLRSIRADLVANIEEMERYLQIRSGHIDAAQRILGYFGGARPDDYSAFNADAVGIYSWQRFYQTNNTYEELVNSGNFGLLGNTRIKHGLLDIETLYRKMKGEEDHFRFDSETLIYGPLYALMDLQPLVEDFAFTQSGGKSGRRLESGDVFEDYFHHRMLKNGFLMTVIEFDTMNAQMREMKSLATTLIAEIDAEIAR
ncbi:MAG: hypothetical protein KDJ14_16505 [Xanthomonadales bacterium]|nr:hypothetical protein [Xanthomonadales bacterium]